MTIARRYVIRGEPVSAKNHMRRVWAPKKKRYVFVKSEAASSWLLDAISQLVKQRNGVKTIRGPVRVNCDVYQADARRDLDNALSAAADALQESRVIEDDSQIVELNARKRLDADTPRVELTVIPMEA